MVKALIFNILLLVLIFCVFQNATVEHKRILFVPIGAVCSFLWYIIYKTRENNVSNVHLRIFCRIFKFVIVYILFYSLKQIVYIPYTAIFHVSVALMIVLDILRAYIYELSKERILKRLITGMFDDILKFHIITNHKEADSDLNNLIGALEKFHANGPPKKLDAEEKFPLWSDNAVEFKRVDNNDQTSNEEEELASSLGRESVIDTVSYNRVILRSKYSRIVLDEDFANEVKATERLNRDVFNLVPSELYKFEYHDPNKKETMPPDYPDDTFDTDEATPIDEDEPEDIAFEDFDERQFHWLYLEKWKQQEEERHHGKITLESLARIYGEEKAQIVYEVLSFKRSEDLILSIFKENVRQINNEQENLYNATDSSLALIRIVYWTCIVIEGLFIYTIISSYLQIQPLLIKLTLPIFVVPILPSLKNILEDFFFLVFSHPYDAGDRVHIDKENYIVRNINMFSTVLMRWDGMRCLIPNNKIKDKVLVNIKRSHSQHWRIQFLLDSETSTKRIDLLKKLLERYLMLDGAYKSFRVDLEELVDSAYIRLSIIVEHFSNFQNGFLMWNTHSKFIRIVNKSLYVLKVRALPLTKRVYFKNEEVQLEEDSDLYGEYLDYMP